MTATKIPKRMVASSTIVLKDSNRGKDARENGEDVLELFFGYRSFSVQVSTLLFFCHVCAV